MVIENIINVVDFLKVIVCVGVGVDNININVVILKGILVINVLDGNMILVIEYILVMLLLMVWNIL